jgi:hypothetical protein
MTIPANPARNYALWFTTFGLLGMAAILWFDPQVLIVAIQTLAGAR